MGIHVSLLATNIDAQMIGHRNIAPPDTPIEDLPVRNGDEIGRELGGRVLLRYCSLTDLSTFRLGTTREIYTTPTPYPPDQVISNLELPGVALERPFALVLDPRSLETVAGPRFIWWGLGIEYILLAGFEPKSILSKWEVVLA
ncbi:hypothetical protein [Streptomyces aureus]|uniref:hypothetical protein n=1 Tax=Streptomyces aureus TaxID=193461 RepID=UPI0006E38545|nr:hypothetical protein [Streptomyces aureus]